MSGDAGSGGGGSQEPLTAAGSFYIQQLGVPDPASIDDAASAWRAAPIRSGQQGESTLVISPGSVRLKTTAKSTTASRGRTSRGPITGWSPASRRNMYFRLATLDYSPWRRAIELGNPVAMITLTLPGDWLAVAPNAQRWRALVDAFRRRWERQIGPIFATWKREHQRRGAAHLHLMTPTPPRVGDETFHDWLSRTWYEVVGSGDERHLRAGTGVDWVRGLRIVDPMRAARYFAGHAGPSQTNRKLYQDQAPAEWTRHGSVGRSWGYWGLKPKEESVALSADEVVEIRRILRRLDRARRRVRRTRVRRVNRATGEITFRWVHRRNLSRAWNSGSVRGGVLLTEDGPQVASAMLWLREGPNADRRVLP